MSVEKRERPVVALDGQLVVMLATMVEMVVDKMVVRVAAAKGHDGERKKEKVYGGSKT